jgi:adenylate cyclase, class 2
MGERTNFEIKARCKNISLVREILISNKAEFKGVDFQKDIYFNVNKGRLKIREGLIENCIVYYERPDDLKPKKCSYNILQFSPGDTELESLKKIMVSALGIKITVEKKREIYFIGNIKFHLDTIEGLGNFLEIEAIGENDAEDKLLSEQCSRYLEELGVKDDDLIGISYSDMIKIIG